ncbi:DUF4136 domain-containing protein [Pontibacter diazotrophicus]|uniref:DUF4136 domain-containing protein n=1 Tax=Pontibacter diazotrophicus TaxID=1400979 RepID=A0A3D8L263_9BACT|nr:DUF4136 domain-containing protein [Pontibacter diazotrophicus]RDV11539.1 DUF4136 domain-containing protein [Pontibacter diazotrophicus]
MMKATTPFGIFFLLFIFLLSASGCARLPLADVQYVYDPTVNYRKYRTFGWYRAEVPTPVAGGSGPAFSTLVDDRVKGAVASELVKQGLDLVVDGTPDLLVAYDIAVDTAQLVTQDSNLPPSYGYAYWYGYRYRYSYAGVPNYMDIRRYNIGTLVIDLIDPNTNELVWRGWVDSEIDPAALENSYIPVVVANIMSRFPPTPDITH